MPASDLIARRRTAKRDGGTWQHLGTPLDMDNDLSDVADQSRALQHLGIFANKAAAVAATVLVTLDTIYLQGYYSAGDGGEGQYKRSVSEPAHPAKFQDASGAWFGLVEQDVSIRQTGAKGDATTDDWQAITDSVQYAGITGCSSVYVPGVSSQLGLYYKVTKRILHDSYVRIHGVGRDSHIRNPNTSAVLAGDQSCIGWGAYRGSGEDTVEDETFYPIRPLTFDPAAFTTGSATIASGAITVSAQIMTVDIEGGAPTPGTDNLDTMNSGSAFDIVVLKALHTQRTVVVRNGIGNIFTMSGSNVSISDTEIGVWFIKIGSNWREFNPRKSVIFPTAANASNFAVGDVVFLRNTTPGDVPDAGDPQVHFQHSDINEVEAVDSTNGIVTLMYPHYRKDAKGGGTIAISSATYNDTTGAVAVTTSGAHGLAVGDSLQMTALTGTGQFAKLSGIAVFAEAGTSGTTINYTQPANDTASTLPGASTITGGTVKYGMWIAKSSGNLLDDYNDPILIRKDCTIENVKLSNHYAAGKGIFIFGGALRLTIRNVYLEGSDAFALNCVQHSTFHNIEALISSKLCDLATYCAFIDIYHIRSFTTTQGLAAPDTKAIIGQMCHNITFCDVYHDCGTQNVIALNVSRCTDIILRDWTIMAYGCTDTINAVAVTGGDEFGADGLLMENFVVHCGNPAYAVHFDNAEASQVPEKWNVVRNFQVYGSPTSAAGRIDDGSNKWYIDGFVAPGSYFRNQSTDPNKVIVRNSVSSKTNAVVNETGVVALTTTGAATTAKTYAVNGCSSQGGWELEAWGKAITDSGAATRWVGFFLDTTTLMQMNLEVDMGTQIDIANDVSNVYDDESGNVTLISSMAHGLGVGQNIVVAKLAGTGAFASLQGSYVTLSGTTGSTIKFRVGTGGLGTITITDGIVSADAKPWHLKARVQNAASNVQLSTMQGHIGDKTGPDSTQIMDAKKTNVSFSTPRNFTLKYFLDGADPCIVVEGWSVRPFGHDSQL